LSSNLPRGLATLELLARHVDGLPLHSIADALDTSRSTAHRVLAELVAHGYVRQEGEFNPYRLTLKLATLGLTYLADTGVTELVQPILDNLASTTGELVRMSLVEGERLIWVARAQGAQGGLRYDATSDPGEEVRLFCGSNGQAWLSCLSDEKALEIVARQGFGDPGSFGPNAPRTIQAFLDCLRAARRRGYAAVHDSYEVGISSMGVAVRYSGEERVIGALSIAGPTARLTPQRMEELAPELLATAAELSKNSAGIRALAR
jgi:IclR family transcriptional regulator, acetate operon repressor